MAIKRGTLVLVAVFFLGCEQASASAPSMYQPPTTATAATTKAVPIDFSDLPETWGGKTLQCNGYNEEYAACPDNPTCNEGCKPQHCEFAEWEEWFDAGGCSGLMFSHRSIAVSNNECGRPCRGEKIRAQPAKLPKDCIGESKPCEYMDWSDWSSCSSNLTQRLRHRATIHAVGEGEGCEGTLKETEPCEGMVPIEPIDCVFQEWQEWTSCSVSCGEGRHSRLRKIDRHAEHSGYACEDTTLETRTCVVQPCPDIDCKVGDWVDWEGDCSEMKTQLYRSRKILAHSSGKGRPCDYHLSETKGCEKAQQKPKPPLTDWSEWSRCSRECGNGMRVRNREVQWIQNISGAEPVSEVEPCNTEPCGKNDRDCMWRAWSDWSGCDVNCGLGSMMRTRGILHEATGVGQGCLGVMREMATCEQDPCKPIDCVWGSWDDWSGCSRRCDGGTKTRHRTIEKSPRYGGRLCPPEIASEVTSCNVKPCTPDCKQGEWADWGEWSKCSCRVPYRWRRRDVLDVNYCGSPPSGLKFDYAACEADEAQGSSALTIEGKICGEEDQDCTFYDWADWSGCSCSCFGVSERIRNIKEHATGNGAACNSSLKELRPCNSGTGFGETHVPRGCHGSPPVDCKMEDWQEWSRCSVSCGGGQRERTRHTEVFPHGGGKACPKELSVVEQCNTQPCMNITCKDCEWGDWSEWGDCSACRGEKWRHRSIKSLPNSCGRQCTSEPAKQVAACDGSGGQCKAPEFCAWTQWTDPPCSTDMCGAVSVMRSRSLKLVSAKELSRLKMPDTCFKFCGDYDVVTVGDATMDRELMDFQRPNKLEKASMRRLWTGRKGEREAHSKLTCDELGWPDVIHHGCGAYTGGAGIPGVCSSISKCESKPESYETAKSHCENKGARLCSAVELLNLEAAGFCDEVYVWSDTPCNSSDGKLGHEIVTAGHCGEAPKSMCSADTESPDEQQYGPCCGDVEVACSEKSCEELNWPDETTMKIGVGIKGVCGSENINCNQSLGTFDDAFEYCENMGARLCTGSELMEVEAVDSGCGFGSKLVWSTTSCPDGGFLAVSVDVRGGRRLSEGPSFECLRRAEKSARVGLCCADTKAQSTCTNQDATVEAAGDHLPVQTLRQVFKYSVIKDRRCGGTSIHTWADSSQSNFGIQGFSLAECKEICALHAECKAFTLRESDNRCSTWKGGRLNPLTLTPGPYKCYTKKEVFPEKKAMKCLKESQLDAAGLKHLGDLVLAPVAIFGMNFNGCLTVAFDRLKAHHVCYNMEEYMTTDDPPFKFLQCMYGKNQNSFVFFDGAYYDDGFRLSEQFFPEEDFKERLASVGAAQTCEDNFKPPELLGGRGVEASSRRLRGYGAASASCSSSFDKDPASVFKFGTVTCENTMDNKTRLMTFHNIGKVNGAAVDMLISPMGGKEWRANIQPDGGMCVKNSAVVQDSGIAKIGFAAGFYHKVNVCIVPTGAKAKSAALKVPKLAVSIFDMDGMTPNQKEIITLGPIHDYRLPDKPAFTYKQNGDYITFTSRDAPIDNPTTASLAGLLEAQVAASATVHFEGRNCFSLEVDVSGYTEIGSKSTRNVLITLGDLHPSCPPTAVASPPKASVPPLATTGPPPKSKVVTTKPPPKSKAVTTKPPLKSKVVTTMPPPKAYVGTTPKVQPKQVPIPKLPPKIQPRSYPKTTTKGPVPTSPPMTTTMGLVPTSPPMTTTMGVVVTEPPPPILTEAATTALPHPIPTKAPFFVGTTPELTPSPTSAPMIEIVDEDDDSADYEIEDQCEQFSDTEKKDRCMRSIIHRGDTFTPCQWTGTKCIEATDLTAHGCPKDYHTFHDNCRSTSPRPEDYWFLMDGGASNTCSGVQQTNKICLSHHSCEPGCTPQDCEFSAWSDWHKPTCVGLRERHRVMKVIANECGRPCDGPIIETDRANASCPHGPVDCKVGPWQPWSHCRVCSPTLQKYRSRSILQAPAEGGKMCPKVLEETATCEANVADPGPCKFSSWNGWGACSTTCGGGYTRRSRSIARPNSKGFAPCAGPLQEIKGCGSQLCVQDEADCEFTDWSAWSDCNRMRERFRKRMVDKPAGKHGVDCVGPMNQVMSCDEHVVDCRVSDWTAWSQCDRTCGGGQMMRQRQIHEFPRLGGALCPSDLIQITYCSTDTCGEDDCQVSDWTEWGACSVTCGSGRIRRERHVTSERKQSGAGCTMPLGEYRPCTLSACTRNDCKWADWNDWGDCSCTCGGGQRVRNRNIAVMPAPGGKQCDPLDKEIVEPCNIQKCSNECTDGSFEDWTEWSGCSASCLGGQRYRTRNVHRMASHCGKAPSGNMRETEYCNVGLSCGHDIDCAFGSWGLWSGCTLNCNGLKRRSRRIETYGKGTGKFCEGDLKVSVPCNTGCEQKGQPVDCILEDWSDWSSCTRECGGGQHSRMRGISVPAAFGGKPCQGSLEQVKECARNSCDGPDRQDCVPGDWKDWGACGKCGGQRVRYRSHTKEAKNGGRPCPAQNTQEVGPCPRGCEAPKKFCNWGDWGDWGRCSTSCGPGQRDRRRHLELTDDPVALDTIGLSDEASVYEELLGIDGRDAESLHFQELIAAFAGGCLSILVVFVAVRSWTASRTTRRMEAAAPASSSRGTPLLFS